MCTHCCCNVAIQHIVAGTCDRTAQLDESKAAAKPCWGAQLPPTEAETHISHKHANILCMPSKMSCNDAKLCCAAQAGKQLPATQCAGRMAHPMPPPVRSFFCPNLQHSIIWRCLMDNRASSRYHLCHTGRGQLSACDGRPLVTISAALGVVMPAVSCMSLADGARGAPAPCKDCQNGTRRGS